MSRDEITYRRGRLSADQLLDEIARFWEESGTSPGLQLQLDGLGFDLGALKEIDQSELIKVRVDSSGTDPASVIFAISLAPAANRVLKDLWATILLPRIRRRWGDDAVGDEIESRPDE
jgi:hypothetical protein